MWREDVPVGRTGEIKSAVKHAPSEPYLTDEYEPTDSNLWEKCLAVVNGDLREFTLSGRTIHAPNEGRGYENMPNPYGMAWAVKQYKGFGGAWRGQKEAIERLRVMANGGVSVTAKGALDDLKARGLVKLAGQSNTHAYWDITAAGMRMFHAGLDEELDGRSVERFEATMTGKKGP